MTICRSLLAVLVLSTAAMCRAEDAPDPTTIGPYPVGVTTTVLVDHSRHDDATKGPRTIPTEIWYPATDDSKDLPKNKLSDYLFSGQSPSLNLAIKGAFKVKLEELDGKYKNIAIRDARVREGKFPLVVFSHGNGGMRFQSTFWCDYIASHGYIVASCDHTGNSAATVVNGKIVIHTAKMREKHAVDRPADVSFIIDTMLGYAKGEDSRFAGKIDTKQIAVAGHSFGGFTAGAVINTDKRVKAIIPMTPVFGPGVNNDVPMLLFQGAEDSTIGAEGNARAKKYFDEAHADKYFVSIKDAGHFSFSDMGQFQPTFGDGVGVGKRVTKPGEELTYLSLDKVFEITNAYSTAFLGVYLKGQNSYRPYIEKNEFPAEIDFSYTPATPVDAAKSTDGKPANPGDIVINVDGEGRITIDSKNYDATQLEAFLKNALANYLGQGVAIRADKASRYQSVAEVLDICKRSGIRKLDVAVQQ